MTMPQAPRERGGSATQLLPATSSGRRGPSSAMRQIPLQIHRRFRDDRNGTCWGGVYIYIYGPSIRKTPHTHIRHPVLHSAARHHRLPSSLSERHPRHSHTLPPPVTDPPPPAPLRTLVRQKTLAIAHYFIYIHIYSFTPLPLHPRKASDASIYICLHPLTSFPPSVRKPRPGQSYAGKISLQSKV